ncbi:hypothetical protein [Actinophytocola sp.]|uniref:hypothetical protein n=1 Tax=Actinophytocola sp. TaxID=1872138 RepID=UPI002D7F6C6C|nr:hypothetical protein [Actinophytocola sp.]HET9139870.1 hypothetical protein [Actinophytocola sp.]
MLKIAVTMAVAVAGLSIPAQQASAGGFCVEPLCGDVFNRSGNHAIRIAGCWHDGSIERWEGDELPCDPKMDLPNGQDSDDYSGFNDTDAFRAFRGCITSYAIGGGAIRGLDRRGRSSLWIRFHNEQNVTITGITCFN